jgi:hypothetical protein
MGLKDTIVYGAAGNPDKPPEGGGGQSSGGRGWFRSHLWAIIITAVLFFVGIGIGTSSGQSKSSATGIIVTTTVAGGTITATGPAATVTDTITSTVTKVKRVKVKPAGPSGTIQGEGTFLVGVDIQPGTYRTSAADSGNCYYEVDRDLKGGLNSIITNDNTSGPTVVQIPATAKAFTDSGCNGWTRIG